MTVKTQNTPVQINARPYGEPRTRTAGDLARDRVKMLQAYAPQLGKKIEWHGVRNLISDAEVIGIRQAKDYEALERVAMVITGLELEANDMAGITPRIHNSRSMFPLPANQYSQTEWCGDGRTNLLISAYIPEGKAIAVPVQGGIVYDNTVLCIEDIDMVEAAIIQAALWVDLGSACEQDIPATKSMLMAMFGSQDITTISNDALNEAFKFYNEGWIDHGGVSSPAPYIYALAEFIIGAWAVRDYNEISAPSIHLSSTVH